jgi:hypothetical protein
MVTIDSPALATAFHKIALPTLLRRAGLPAGFFQQEKIYATTAEFFALWRAIAEMSPDPGIGLKFGAEPRLERYHPTAIAAVCSRSFRDALQRLARYKQLTCPEEIRVHTTRDEASVEFFYQDANSFFRALHLWEGTSPGEWRTLHRMAEVEVLGR